MPQSWLRDPRYLAIAMVVLITALALLFPKRDPAPEFAPDALPSEAGTAWSSAEPIVAGCLKEAGGQVEIQPGCRYLGVDEQARYHLYLSWEPQLPEDAGPVQVAHAALELAENQSDSYGGAIAIVPLSTAEWADGRPFVDLEALRAAPGAIAGRRIGPRSLRAPPEGEVLALNQLIGERLAGPDRAVRLLVLATDDQPSSVDEYSAELKFRWQAADPAP